MNLSDEIIRNAIAMAFTIAGTLLSGSIVALIVMWGDVRSLKKATGSSFKKIRALEEKVYGFVSSELSERDD